MGEDVKVGSLRGRWRERGCGVCEDDGGSEGGDGSEGRGHDDFMQKPVRDPGRRGVVGQPRGWESGSRHMSSIIDSHCGARYLFSDLGAWVADEGFGVFLIAPFVDIWTIVNLVSGIGSRRSATQHSHRISIHTATRHASINEINDMLPAMINAGVDISNFLIVLHQTTQPLHFKRIFAQCRSGAWHRVNTSANFTEQHLQIVGFAPYNHDEWHQPVHVSLADFMATWRLIGPEPRAIFNL